jgi:cytochrome c-type biogenesis protein CcmH|tara:strand:- start:914 stop:1288 length:375 start_codon:yes stop_codon:yes gene_type:complete
MKFKKIIIIYIFLFSTLYADENNLELIKIYKNLRCLICQGQSIADSNSDFASTVKLVVQDQVKEGKSKEEIYDFLISKYGEWIVYQPTFTKTNFLLWAIPYLLLAFGGIVIYFLVRKNKYNKSN